MSAALTELLYALADDDFVLGFADSEWTGIAPHLEEDVAMSSLAQDELGHASAWYGLLAELTGGDPDRTRLRPTGRGVPASRLVDHGRGDWARTMTRRWLYDTANAVRLEALADSSDRSLAELAVKVRREETYHLAHGEAWVERLAGYEGEPRRRLIEALELVGPGRAERPRAAARGGEPASRAGSCRWPRPHCSNAGRSGSRPILAGLDLALPAGRGRGPRPGHRAVGPRSRVRGTVDRVHLGPRPRSGRATW